MDVTQTRTEQQIERWARDPEVFAAELIGAPDAGPFDVRWWEAAAPALKAARQRVDAHAAVAQMRGISVMLARAADVDRAIIAVETDAGLSDAGKIARRREIVAARDEQIDGALRFFDNAATRLRADTPPPLPLRLAVEDLGRVQLAVLRAPSLSVAELQRELAQALERKDRPLLDAVLPVARSRGPSSEQAPAARLEFAGLDEVVARAEALLVTVELAAHVYADALVERLTAQRDLLLGELRHGSARSSIALRAVDTSGRRGGTFGDLAPIPDEFFEVGPPPIRRVPLSPLT